MSSLSHLSAPDRASSGSLARATDVQLAWLATGALFVLAAWPVLLVDVPPLQDLPNHLAASAILDHPQRHPDLVFNGFFKTNSALFTWLWLVGPMAGLKAGALLFVLGVLALGAFAIPRFVLAFGGRRRMAVATLFAWPMVHNWFVSTGMLDFAAAVWLAMLLFVLLDAQARAPSFARGAAIAGLALVTWYAHVFPVLVVHLLVGLHVVSRRSWRERGRQALWLIPPLLPSSVLTLRSFWLQATNPGGAMTGYMDMGRVFLPVWELVYNLWADWTWAFTWLEVGTLVPCVALGVWAVRRWRDDARFFGPIGFLALAGFFCLTPYVATNWANVNGRFIPFLWFAALVRVPERVPRWAVALLGACALSYSAGMGIDYVRLGREWDRFAAGTSVVPEGASLLPLIFQTKKVSQNTRSLMHAWGLYVVDRDVSAPLLFAHSQNYPIMYRRPPPPQFTQLVLENFAPSMRSPEWLCRSLRSGGVAVDDCDALWRSTWAAFWRAATPAFDRVLLWDAPDAVTAALPPDYRVVLRRDELVILARVSPP